jgi:hypothetical protein
MLHVEEARSSHFEADQDPSQLNMTAREDECPDIYRCFMRSLRGGRGVGSYQSIGAFPTLKTRQIQTGTVLGGQVELTKQFLIFGKPVLMD